MYSRLYTNILNHFPQIDHCASIHHIYTDSSLFGLFASFVPHASRNQGNTPAQIMPHLVHQLSLLLYQAVPVPELSRAKNQLKSSLMMALESQAVEVEDLGRQVRNSQVKRFATPEILSQVLVHNRKIPLTEMTDKIDEVSPESVLRVAKRIFGPDSGNKATVVTMGRDDIGDWQAVLQKYGVAAS
jgi:processing peptidase subunit alpha